MKEIIIINPDHALVKKQELLDLLKELKQYYINDVDLDISKLCMLDLQISRIMISAESNELKVYCVDDFDPKIMHNDIDLKELINDRIVHHEPIIKDKKVKGHKPPYKFHP